MARATGFVVTTVCRSEDEFIDRYYSRVEARSLFVSVIEESALGGECAFAILLADKRPMLAGVCEVIEVYRDAQNEFGRRGMRIGIARLGADSQRIWRELTARREALMPRVLLDDDAVDMTYDAIPVEVEEEISRALG